MSLEYPETEEECELWLALHGMTIEDFQRRAYCEIDGMKRTYFFDGEPIVESEYSFDGGIFKFEVRAVTHG